MPEDKRDYCKNATSPINIVKGGELSDCVLKCDYNFDYGTYSPNITNKKNHLALTYAGKINPVKYNAEQYNVREIRIYQPSLHQYNGKTADGEILIIHGGPGKNLIVSVPFKTGEKNDKGSSHLTELLTEAAQRVPASDTSPITGSNSNFSLNNFIPKNGFYSYTGTLPYGPCNGTYTYIVYNVDNNTLNISDLALLKLKKIIAGTTAPIKETNFFYNKNGANSGGNDDNIYIDCQPVNDEGQILVPEGTTTTTTTDNPYFDMIEDDIGRSIVGLLVGLVIAYGFIKLFEGIRKKMTPHS